MELMFYSDMASDSATAHSPREVVLASFHAVSLVQMSETERTEKLHC